MKKYIYAFYDTVSGSVIALQDNHMAPTEFVTIKKRELLMQPVPVFEDAEIYHIGEYDDETLDGKISLKVKVGDFKDEFLKLRAYAEAKKSFQEVKEKEEVKQDVCA